MKEGQDVTFKFRLPASMKDRWKKCAELFGREVSDYVRTAVEERVRKDTAEFRIQTIERILERTNIPPGLGKKATDKIYAQVVREYIATIRVLEDTKFLG